MISSEEHPLEDGNEPLAYGLDSHLSRDILSLPVDMFHTLSRAVMPTDAGRSSAHVNASGSSRSSSGTYGAQGGFRQSSILSRVQAVSATDLQWTESRTDLEEELQSEKAAGAKTRVPDWKSEDTRLAERLQKLKLDMFVMEGDGNCQFRSVSFNLYGSEHHHLLVRRRALDHMRQHAPEYEPFLGDAAAWAYYLKEMACFSTWGDELTLRAICDSYGFVFNVVTSEQHNWLMRYTPQVLQKYDGSPKEIFLTYIAPCHYNAIRRRSRSSL